ncbi:MAG: hypothetical protein ACTTJ3_01980 [Treponema sp.]
MKIAKLIIKLQTTHQIKSFNKIYAIVFTDMQKMNSLSLISS